MTAMPDWLDEILRVEVGSTAHGISVGDDDRDEMGVAIEPREYLIGLSSYEGQRGFEQYTFRTAWQRLPPGEGGPRRALQPRSEPGDLDVVVYSLRKWCRMALSGNPTVLLLLYSSKVIVSTEWGDRLRDLAPAFCARRVGEAYLHYLRQQRQRLEGSRGQKDVNRPELVAKFGFDTKYASHVLRLGIQGCEYVLNRQLIVPMEAGHRQLIQAVRRGDVPYADVLAQAHQYEHLLTTYLADCPLPATADVDRINTFLVEVYQALWQ
jgi:predicted nucleotidyltransferase